MADGDGNSFVYHTMAQINPIPFLMMCRWMADEGGIYIMGMHNRNNPVLRAIPTGGTDNHGE